MDGVKLGFTWFLGVYGSRLDLKSVWDAIRTFSMPFNPTYGLTGVYRELEFAPTRIAVSSQQSARVGNRSSLLPKKWMENLRGVRTTFCIRFRDFAL